MDVVTFTPLANGIWAMARDRAYQKDGIAYLRLVRTEHRTAHWLALCAAFGIGPSGRNAGTGWTFAAYATAIDSISVPSAHFDDAAARRVERGIGRRLNSPAWTRAALRVRPNRIATGNRPFAQRSRMAGKREWPGAGAIDAN